MVFMAWRLDEAVEHGIIDNTVEGTTTGKIWLAGRDEPLILSLNGDCWRDLAGSVLEFENPNPQVVPDANALDTEQSGIIGDITASRKARIPEISDLEIMEYHRQSREVPCQWRNILYLEWFSEINGRVMIEAAGYKLEVSSREWEMDEDLEEAQKLANMNTMRDFMAQIIRRIDPSEYIKDTKPGDARAELDEFEWEERLKESDRLTDAYQETLEKYIDDPDAERKEAFVMGWDGLLSAMADRDEEEDDEDDDFEDDGEDWLSSDDEDFEDEEDSSDEENCVHPLQARAHEVAMRCLVIVDLSHCDGEADPAESFSSRLMQISSKLAGVLNGRASGYEPEAGFVLAVLKRCLNWINEAVGSCNQLIDSESDTDHLAALEHLRADVFGIRDEIIELRLELKQR
jgi:hypothetical protein